MDQNYATGDDSNIDVELRPKGTGETKIGTGLHNSYFKWCI